jgi:creatinine amidohydrolase/Fe(II)-dependent formamide hydrolase-like protein
LELHSQQQTVQCHAGTTRFTKMIHVMKDHNHETRGKDQKNDRNRKIKTFPRAPKPNETQKKAISTQEAWNATNVENTGHYARECTASDDEDSPDSVGTHTPLGQCSPPKGRT